jgi:hypothetical protein
MAEPVDGSRRRAIRTVVTGISAGFLLRISPSEASEKREASEKGEASDKMTRQQAEYQDTPSGLYSCATCTLFEPPKSCKVVDGDVSRDGWCKAFALAD